MNDIKKFILKKIVTKIIGWLQKFIDNYDNNIKGMYAKSIKNKYGYEVNYKDHHSPDGGFEPMFVIYCIKEEDDWNRQWEENYDIFKPIMEYMSKELINEDYIDMALENINQMGKW
jgi:ribosomal protein S17E